MAGKAIRVAVFLFVYMKAAAGALLEPILACFNLRQVKASLNAIIFITKRF